MTNSRHDFAAKAATHRRKTGVIAADFYPHHVEATNDVRKAVTLFYRVWLTGVF